MMKKSKYYLSELLRVLSKLALLSSIEPSLSAADATQKAFRSRYETFGRLFQY